MISSSVCELSFPQELSLVAEEAVEFPAQGLEWLQDVKDREKQVVAVFFVQILGCEVDDECLHHETEYELQEAETCRQPVGMQDT